MIDLLNSEFVSIGTYSFTFRQLFTFVLVLTLIIAARQILMRTILPWYFQREDVTEKWQRKIKSAVHRILWATVGIAVLWSFDLDQDLYQIETYSVRYSSLFVAWIIIQAARILDWVAAKVLLHRYYVRRGQRTTQRSASPVDIEEKASRTVQYIVYTLSIIVIIGVFNLNRELFQLPLENGTWSFRVSSIFVALLIFLFARLTAWVITQLILYSYYHRNDIDAGRRFAINQLVTYFIYVIAIFIIVENLGIDLTVLWGGIAALLVGIGLGMQDVFRDLVAGVILLSERSLEVDDVVSVDNTIGVIQKIGLRTSILWRRDETILIIPNSKLVSTNVINWTHQHREVRFSVSVGIAYDADVKLAMELLLRAAAEQEEVQAAPAPFVRFSDFADSAKQLELFFWTLHLLDIEDVNSRLRVKIATLFEEEGITIPFPQRDVWMRSAAP